jgi:hypothetical protein
MTIRLVVLFAFGASSPNSAVPVAISSPNMNLFRNVISIDR